MVSLDFKLEINPDVTGTGLFVSGQVHSETFNDYLLTESGEYLLTESGELIKTEDIIWGPTVF